MEQNRKPHTKKPAIRDTIRLEVDTRDRTECWNWERHISPEGYGRVYVNKRMMLVHRYTYTIDKGPIPEGLDIDHLCRNRACYNPNHLEAVTRSVNLSRSPLMGRAQSAKTHCPHGHEYSEENTTHRNGRRHCRSCAKSRFWDLEKHNPISPCPQCSKKMRRGNIKRHIAESCPHTRLGLGETK